MANNRIKLPVHVERISDNLILKEVDITIVQLFDTSQLIIRIAFELEGNCF